MEDFHFGNRGNMRYVITSVGNLEAGIMDIGSV
jgi:hypothetical protein